MRILSIKTVALILKNFFYDSSCYLCNVSSFFCVTPTCDETLGTTEEVKLWKAHRPHALVVSEWRLKLNKCQVIIVAGVRSIVWMFDNLFYWYILLVAFLSIQVMISCYNKNKSIFFFKVYDVSQKKRDSRTHCWYKI